jgi:hypothetical protein
MVPQSKMNTALYDSLVAELADIERQQQDPTLPHSDQQLLDQAWEDVMNRLDELETIVEEAVEDDWRDARVVVEEDEDSRPATPVPAEPVRIAPPPPRSVTLVAGFRRDGTIVAQMPDGQWVPAPPLSASRQPPPIAIPMWTGSPSVAPPPPRPAGVTICNCDSDGQCAYCEEEERERWNNMVDDRPGCEHCAGCVYCQEGGGYDGADEV